ncbi:PPOX class F420-dependent oxidoreductase [Streptomyces meridianus]|uniref:PPOX class F420-dependent oxidoreductase n=1 Tax=Streptomyces meridianus TaxID=2938945 RepID=A0ABT0X2L3_9ACTN|nr:PPOX class F420-dependent oxidoreductase [Streptomyces meridianus]MCM2576689.1 PPOX class F420-dependent oxidoreductase [Streptomyces meridianus]
MIPEELADSPYISLVTFRRSGTAVPTPVWAASDGSTLYVWTRDDSGKVKRIRNNDRVTVAPCDARGRTAPEAPVAEGRARLLDAEGTGTVRRLLARKYGWRFRLVDSGGALLRLGKRPHVGIAITF